MSVKNPFDAVERILRRVIQAEIDDWLTVETVFVEQLGHIAVNGLFTALAPVPLNRDGHFFEAVLGDEDGEGLRARIVGSSQSS